MGKKKQYANIMHKKTIISTIAIDKNPTKQIKWTWYVCMNVMYTARQKWNKKCHNPFGIPRKRKKDRTLRKGVCKYSILDCWCFFFFSFFLFLDVEEGKSEMAHKKGTMFVVSLEHVQ
jgi:hypothetical protein